MRRRGLQKLAKAWWRFWLTDSDEHNRADQYIYDRLIAHAVGRHARPGLIAALVRTTPTASDLPSIGTNFFEDWYSDAGIKAIEPFALADLTRGELRACLSGVWPSLLTEAVEAGMEVPLPDTDVAWLLDMSAPGRQRSL